jgi:hypothetical protein
VGSEIEQSAVTNAKARSDQQPGNEVASYRLLLLAAATVAAYHNSFTVPFIFDDRPFLANTVEALSLGQALIGVRPVVQLSLALNHALGHLNVHFYHLFNVAIHILAGLTLFGVTRRTLLLPSVQSRWTANASGLGFAVSLLWLLHPLQTQSVTYIVQRAESLMGLFYLLTLYGLVRGATVPGPRRTW